MRHALPPLLVASLIAGAPGAARAQAPGELPELPPPESGAPAPGGELPPFEPGELPPPDVPPPGVPSEPPSEPGPSDLSEVIESEEQFFALEQVVVAASKRAQRIEDAPARITVISAEDIRRYGFRTLAEALRIVPGWHVVNNHDFHYANNRGVLFSGNFNTRLLVLVDGHSNAEPWGATSPVTEDFGVDLSQIERIEVLNGPGSSLYGTNAFFGLVNVVTRAPSDKGAFGELDFGSHGRTKVLLGHRQKFSKEVGYEVSLRAFGVDGPGLFFPEHAGGLLGGHARGSANRELAYSAFAKFVADELRVLGKLAVREKRIPTAPYETVFNDDRNEVDDVAGFVDVRYGFDLAKSARLNLRAYYDRFLYDDFLAYEPDDDYPGGFLFRDEGDAEWGGGEVQLDIEAYRGKENALRLLFGGEAVTNETRSHSFIVEDPEFDIEDSRSFLSAAGYAQAEWTLWDKILLIGGARYDYHEIFDEALSPRAALIYHPSLATTVKALYNRGFRNPSTYEQYFDDNDQILRPYEILHPETIDTAELVVEQHFGERFSATAGGYWFRAASLFGEREVDCTTPLDEPLGSALYPEGDLDEHPCGLERDTEGALLLDDEGNAIGRGVEDEGSRKQFFNSGSFGGIGGDVSVRYRDPEGMRAFANFALQGILRDGDLVDPDRAPQLLANVGLSYPLWSEKLFASASANFVGKRQIQFERADLPGVTNVTSLDPYALVNARLLHRRFLGAFDIAFSVYNLLDHRYEEVVAAEDIPPIRSVPQEARTFMLTFGYDN